MSARIIQISDCHLLADREEPFKGIDPHRQLLDVLRLARETVPDCERVVLTGDMAHDEQHATYQVLREHLGDCVQRCRVIPGNHDDRSGIRSVFADRVAQDSGLVCFSERVGRWRLIGIDSQSTGNVHGTIGPQQYDWLSEQLRTNADEPTLLFMHHPPVTVGSGWLDAIGLRDPEPFAGVLSGAPQIRGICSGHIHQEFEGRLGGAAVYCTPATSKQFRPGTPEPEFDALPPGFRVLELGESDFNTHVVRLSVGG